MELVAVIDEPALRRPAGGPAVMRGQLAHLVEAAGLDRVSIQVVPADTGAHCAMSTAFTVLGFGDLDVPDMAYVEHPMGAVHTEKKAEVARAKLVFDRLRSLALSPVDSIAAIRRAAEQM